MTYKSINNSGPWVLCLESKEVAVPSSVLGTSMVKFKAGQLVSKASVPSKL